jgi:putative FmdB family regulatory protein
VPTYQYVCTECGEPLEVVQKFSDDALTECPACAGRLRKVFSAAGIIFKGSGFYRTDSRSGTKAPAASTAKADTAKTGADSGSDSGSAKKSDATPSTAGSSTSAGSTDSKVA